ncbi:MAG: retroviral-like aspartic protease family protein [Candidatus Obscuribacterales bacterium]|nr:retroviral-like aspartic protease family protein [Candidatus Obscuribacterales bacterium]
MKKAQTYLRSSKIALTLLGLSGVLLTSSLPAMGSSYQEGVALYNKGKFNEALAVFNQVSSTGHEDANVVYYSGLCHHQLRDFKQAKACYQKVLQAYPNSSVKGQAQTALSAFYRSGGSGSASSSSSGSGGGGHIVDDEEDGRIDLSRCPPSSRLYYKDTENTAGIAFMVKVSVNNRPIEMVFDTGASSIVLGKNHLAQLGIAPPPANKKPDGYSSGVGSNKPLPSWYMNADIKVADMLIPNCPITVLENLPGEPLLGQTFFKHFAYTIDYGSKSIMLTRKGAAVPSPVGSSVPFVREGNELVVQAQVNGKPYAMYFDTGAMNCAFTAQDCKKLQIEIPDDAEKGISVGVGGETNSYHFPISSLKLGPIEKRNMQVSVVENSKMGRPLLGQSFYAGWQYTIDNERKTINFLRR